MIPDYVTYDEAKYSDLRKSIEYGTESRFFSDYVEWIKNYEKGNKIKWNGAFTPVEYFYIAYGIDKVREVLASENVVDEYGGIYGKDKALSMFEAIDSGKPSVDMMPSDIRDMYSFLQTIKKNSTAGGEKSFACRCLGILDRQLKAHGSGLIKIASEPSEDRYFFKESYFIRLIRSPTVKVKARRFHVDVIESLVTTFVTRYSVYKETGSLKCRHFSPHPVLDEIFFKAVSEEKAGVPIQSICDENLFEAHFVKTPNAYILSRSMHENRREMETVYYPQNLPADAPPFVSLPHSGTFSTSHKKYFSYWKSKADEGIYYDACNEYIFKYLQELVRNSTDYSDVAIKASNIYMRYRDCYSMNVLCDAVLCSKTILPENFVWVPYYTYKEPILIYVLVVYSYFKRGMTGTLGRGVISQSIICCTKESYSYYTPGIVCDIFEDALRAFDEFNMKNGLPTWQDLLQDVSFSTYTGKMFGEVNYKPAICLTVKYPLFETKSGLFGVFAGVMRAVMRTVCKVYGSPAPGTSKLLTKEQNKFLEHYVTDWMTDCFTGIGKNRIEDTHNFTLNSKAITDAADDLEKVTRMMATEEECNVVAKQPESCRKAEGWSGFAGMLDDDLMGFIASVFDNNASAYAKANKRSQNSYVTEINEIAMDSVGDVVFDGRKIIEEYAENLRNLVFGHLQENQ